MLGGSKKERKMPTLLFIQWKKFKERYRGNTHPKKNIFLALKVMKYKRYLKLNN